MTLFVMSGCAFELCAPPAPRARGRRRAKNKIYKPCKRVPTTCRPSLHRLAHHHIHRRRRHNPNKNKRKAPTSSRVSTSYPEATYRPQTRQHTTMDWGFYGWNPWIGRAEKSNKVSRQGKRFGHRARIQKLPSLLDDTIRLPHATLTQRSPLLLSSDLFSPTNQPTGRAYRTVRQG